MLRRGTNNIFYLPLPAQKQSDELSRLLALLPVQSGERVRRIRREEDRRLSLWGELLARGAAACACGVQGAKLELAETASGKPFFPALSGFFFNVSHTPGAVAIAAADEPVGIDIERLRAAVPEVSKRCFAPGEMRRLARESERKDELFWEVWTKKEAYFKRGGEGIFTEAMPRLDTARQKFARQIQSFWRDGYVISVCGGGTDKKWKFHTLTCPEAMRGI